MAVLTNQSVSDAHWYTRDGQPKHTIVRVSGDPRKTTLADARKEFLLPSVTTILDVLSKPQLERWKMDQVALSARHVTQGDRSDSDYCKEVRDKAFQQTTNAADLGTSIHHDLEVVLSGQAHPESVEHSTYILPVIDLLSYRAIVAKKTEVVVTNTDYGYAGTVDLVGKEGRNNWVIDFKTRKSTPGKDSRPYDGHAEQLAAYAAAIFGENALQGHKVRCANIFISTTEPGRVEMYEHTPMAIENAWVTFRCCSQIWINRKGYDPRVVLN